MRRAIDMAAHDDMTSDDDQLPSWFHAFGGEIEMDDRATIAIGSLAPRQRSSWHNTTRPESWPAGLRFAGRAAARGTVCLVCDGGGGASPIGVRVSGLGLSSYASLS